MVDLLALAFVPFQLYVFTSALLALAGILQEQCISSIAVGRNACRILWTSATRNKSQHDRWL
jgi:hypothetical protein